MYEHVEAETGLQPDPDITVSASGCTVPEKGKSTHYIVVAEAIRANDSRISLDVYYPAQQQG